MIVKLKKVPSSSLTFFLTYKSKEKVNGREAKKRKERLQKIYIYRWLCMCIYIVKRKGSMKRARGYPAWEFTKLPLLIENRSLRFACNDSDFN